MPKGAWLARSVEYATLDLIRVMRSSPTLGLDLTFKKKEKKSAQGAWVVESVEHPTLALAQW